MGVLSEILVWSLSRPLWQRDALRRLVTKGDLEESDLGELAALAKAAHGLADNREGAPLEEQHLPTRGPGLEDVTLASVTHHSGVNALAPGQTIRFGPSLTVVYGNNAAGKSGYSRILKRACRARGAEEILGNVLGDSSPSRPSATIRFSVGEEGGEHEWRDQGASGGALGRVSVFDSHCAAVYITEKTDVAFRPFGLDLFDKLSYACEKVRGILEKERGELTAKRASLPSLPEGTAAQKIVSNITSLTNPEDVRSLGTLSGAEKDRLREVRKRLQDLQAKDPEKASKNLNLRAQRFETLSSSLANIAAALSDSAASSLFDAAAAAKEAGLAAKELQRSTFPDDLLEGTGTGSWHALWKEARRYSTEHAYPGSPFPVTGPGARCVLCQQRIIEEGAADRLDRFDKFIQSNVQQELEKAETVYKEGLQGIAELEVGGDSTEKIVEELRLENENLATAVSAFLDGARSRRDKALAAIKEGLPLPRELPALEPLAERILCEAKSLRERADRLLKNGEEEAKDKLQQELLELEAREALGKGLEAILGEIERKKALAAYGACLEDVGTTAITRKSTNVTKRVVTRRLAASFQAELKSLRFTHLEVELKEAGGRRGALYHKLALRRAPGADLPRVVSEGESRALSIATFFAELSTATDRSAIIFDDPVSSLDHDWRESVAKRLAEEACVRQVIVFTHDIVFLLALSRWAEKLGASCQHQYLRRQGIEAGVCSPELPWVAMNVKERIGALRKKWQAAEKLHRTASPDEYEREAIEFYGLLREAWERGVEEVLLNGVVQRYRPSVETLRAKSLSDILAEDCEALESGMSKCSRWLRGHDQAPAENEPVPEPDELKDDIDSLDEWIRAIRKRRN